MPAIQPLKHQWIGEFDSLVRSARDHLMLCAPFVSKHGVSRVREARSGLPPPRNDSLILTDLSPLSVCAGATDPKAVLALGEPLGMIRTVHLPRLHAKVYLADGARAIVTSGNLTLGGLEQNHEYGIDCIDRALAARIERDVTLLASLGCEIDSTALRENCNITDDVRKACASQMRTASRTATRRLNAALRAAEDSLIRVRLEHGPVHAVFAKTIAYLLQRHRQLPTSRLHPLIRRMHPDLCDDSIDRVIDGQRFGKKWKHAVRTAQQQLKKRGQITLRDGDWVWLG